MSTQKDKFLASAQKYIQKGQYERALKDYEQVVTADPKDVKHRQKLAELMVRCNRREDAIREYETIAKYYEENGFNLKSIAVYKQIQRFDPANIEISMALAQLNEKQGLVGNALNEYKTVFDHYQKAGKVEEVIKVLEKMKGVDPHNVDIRMKLAETCYNAGHRDNAYEEYTSVATSLRESGKKEVFERVCQRMQELFPDKKEGALDILSSQVHGGMVQDSIPKLEKLLEDEPGNTRVVALLSEAYRISGDVEKGMEMLREFIRTSPGNTDAMKMIIECEVETGELEGGVALLQQYSPTLLESGCFADLERYYTKFMELAPYDIRLLQGLKVLYETTGDQAKLSDVEVSINILSRESSDLAQEEPEDTSSDTGKEEVATPDFPWQEEIDLSFAPDVDSDSMQELPEAGPVMLNPEDLSARSETVPGAAGEIFDIDISFDMTDMQEMSVAGEADILEQTPLQAEPEIAEEAGTTEECAVPNFLDGLEVDLSSEIETMPSFLDPGSEGLTTDVQDVFSDNILSDESDFSLEETCITLSEELPEAEIVLEPEPVEEKPVSGTAPGFFDPESFEEVSDKFDQTGIVSRFSESLDSQMDSADTETRYNLGIAYMEMALYDEAIGELRAAGKDPARALDCVTLEGMCHTKKGDFANAEKAFLGALSLEGLDTDRILSLRYELGVMYETAGNREGALKVFGEIFQANPGFRDTMKKIARLSGKENGSLDLSDINDADLKLDELA